MLRFEQWPWPFTASIEATWREHRQALLRRGPRYATCLLLAGSLIGATYHFSSQGLSQAAAASFVPSPYDYQPSTYRQALLEQAASGQALPNPGVVELESEQRQQDLVLRQQQALAEQYYQEIRGRDADIAKLSQSLQADNASLGQIATQLGLPKAQLATPKPAPQGGVGAFGPADRAALNAGQTNALAAGKQVQSVQDLADMVKAYLTFPCPLSAGDPRCGQAADHARQELSRGHGLDVNKPDARPTLEFDVAQAYGPTDLYLEPLQEVNGQLVHFHDGIDLASDEGEPVMAAGSGTVTFAGVLPSGADTIEITHAGGVKSLYLHESQLLVQLGQHVQKGQIIGLVGMTGMATGPHVHFSIDDPSGNTVDPMPFVK